MNYLQPDLSRVWSLDIEADGLNPNVIYCIVLINLASREQCSFTPNTIHLFAAWLAERPHVLFLAHNGLAYDIWTIMKVLGVYIDPERVIDTMILSYLYHPRMPGGHSLEAWGERLKFPKGDFHDWSHYSPEMLVYCVNDVELTILVYFALRKRMLSRGYSNASIDLEHRVAVIIAQQQRNGWFFDVHGANTLLGRIREDQEALREPIAKLFPPELIEQGRYNYRITQSGEPHATYKRHRDTYPKLEHYDDGTYGVFGLQTFNIASPKQRLEKLLSLGFKPSKFTKTGQPSVDEEALVAFSKEANIPEAKAIADWLVCFSRGNMIETWLRNVGPDQRIHGKVFSCGAGSRRMTHTTPNTANVPSNEAPYGEACRTLWTVPDVATRCVVGTDAKSIQMRCFAHFLPDPSLGRRYYDTDFCADPHQENADLIGIPRRPVKNVFYANLFGAFPPKLASTAGKVGSKRELSEYGQWIKNELFRVTPGLKEATEAAVDEWRNNDGFLSCPDGGYVRCPSEHAALNYKIQPAEAVIMKQALVFMDQRLKNYDTFFIGNIHDEIQTESDRGAGHEVGKICKQSIRDAGEELNFRVPLDGDYKVGSSWAETH